MHYRELLHFIERQMRMSHIYQPLLIRSLVDAGGCATIRQLAQVFCVQDESELLRYEQTIKKMPVPVLRKHGVIEQDGPLISLTTKGLSFEQKAEVRRLCEDRMQAFMHQRGLKIWDCRLLDDPVPESLRYRVLQASDGRCALCGATRAERPLQVDHIQPRSKGGRTAFENLQVLCAKCNQAKGNKDRTDFRAQPNLTVDPSCLFCDGTLPARAIELNERCLAIQDAYPVATGHVLVIPRRHTSDFFTMTEAERTAAHQLLRILRNKFLEDDPTIAGFNVGVNCGAVAGQTVFHAHIHLILRRRGDTPQPRGGVRGVIPTKMAYSTASKV